MDAHQLRERAAHYRRLAKLIADEQIQDGLLKLATEYDAKADDIAGSEAP